MKGIPEELILPNVPNVHGIRPTGVGWVKPGPEYVVGDPAMIFEKVLFTPERIAEALETVNKDSRILAKATRLVDGKIVPAIDFTRRKVYTSTTCAPQLFESMMREVADVADVFYGVRTEMFEVPRFWVYPVGGHFAPHFDAETVDRRGERVKFNDRDISVVVFLSADYDGGLLYFPDLNRSIIPAVGKVVMFPAGIGYSHGVTEITRGFRCQMVSWLTIEGSERNHIEAIHGMKTQVKR